MEVNTYLIIVIAIIVGEFLINLIVSLLDFYYKPTTNNPSITKDYVKAKNYLKSGIKFRITKMTFDLAVILIIIFTGAFNYLDIFVRGFGYGPIITGLFFFGIFGLVFYLLGLPFKIFNTFAIEEKYHFNKTTKKTFIIDLIKSLAGWILIGTIGLLIILYSFEKAGNLAWLYCWIFITITQVFTMFIYPVFILPVFNKLQILPDGQLKEAIYNYLKSQNINIKMDNIKIIDSSKRTNKSNAFLTGFGINKRVVLSDTLLKNHTIPEIVSIVAHEIGHLKKKHILKKFLLYTIESLLIFYLLSLILINTNFFLAFGVENLSVYIGLILFAIIYTPIAFFFSILTNCLSRRYEFEADEFSAETTSSESMASALGKLGSHNLSNPSPHPWTVLINYSHPPIQDRVERLIK